MKEHIAALLAVAALLLLPPTARAQVSTPLAGGDGKPGATTGPAPDRLPSAALDVPDDYRLDTGDVIAVEVLRHTDVSRTLRIPADGMVRLPRLTTPIPARGRTCAE